jgi:PiT family inorganic phosphate transporter
LEAFLNRHGLPAIPLVPVSSSQAIVGAIIGLGLLKGGRGLRWKTLGGISSGWVATPVIAALISFVSLFFLQNVFQQQTYRPLTYRLTPDAVGRIQRAGMPTKDVHELIGKEFDSAVKLSSALSKRMSLPRKERDFIIESSEVDELTVKKESLARIQIDWITDSQKKAIEKMDGRVFTHKWQLDEALAGASPEWQFKRDDKKYNENLKNKLAFIYKLFRLEGGI